MFHHFKSHSLSDLADYFAKQLTTDPTNTLEPVWIVVQNNEVREWLTLQYAQRKGIAANFNFILPSEFLWLLYRLKKPNVPHELPSDLESMRWTLLHLFRNQPALWEQVPLLDDEKKSERQLYEFCGQLADVFDLYQVYRPDMIRGWAQSNLMTPSADEKWQALIWNKLKEYWAQRFSDELYPGRSQALQELLSWIEDDEAFKNSLPEALHVFGLSQSSKPFLDIITSVSANSEVFYYNLVSQDVVKNEFGELLERWNRCKYNQTQLLSQLAATKKLKTIEQDALKETQEMPSIRLHSCHNRRREVEVLKDEVLRFLDDYPQFNLQDVLVLVPDADAYASTLSTIFGQSKEELALPITNLNAYASDTVEYTIQQLLDVLGSDFKVTEVLQLLVLKPVKEKFGITDSELDLVEEWIIRNKIFFGLGDSVQDAYSWKKGISQLISGFSMELDSLEVYRGLVPDRGVGSTDQIVLASRLSAFVHALKEAHAFTESHKHPEAWLEVIQQLIRLFIGESESTARQLTVLHNKVKKLKTQLALSGFEGKVSFELMRSWLSEKFNSFSSSSGRFGQGITVSTYVPYRSVPFKFIAMLGMNEGVFPRQVVRPSFDLINQNPQAGDRILKEDDAWLFAETLQAAGSHLHLSYEGRDQKTDTEKLPSILIQQMLDIPEPEIKVCKHSLHPFNTSYYDNGEKSYSAYNATVASRLHASDKSGRRFINNEFRIEEEEPGSLGTHDLIQYFCHPCKYFAANKLDISFFDDIQELEDREPFKLQGLDRYYIDHLLFESLQQNKNEKLIYNYAKSAHLIPEALAGKKAFHKEKELVDELWQEVQPYIKGEERDENIECSVNGIHLSGVTGGIYDDTLLTIKPGRCKAGALIEHWIKHLLLIESGVQCSQSLFVSKERKYGRSFIQTLTIKSGDIDSTVISDYVDWFTTKKPLIDSLNFFPETSLAYATHFLKHQDTEAAMKKALKEWEPDKYSYDADAEDFYNQLVWKGEHPLALPSFHERAIRFWTPYLNTQGEGN
ncbi:MAG: hypothetical protein FH748_08820 [Balneolaceae bacterium]|nr:hypothetical protein [Balneolaceae bacterium]